MNNVFNVGGPFVRFDADPLDPKWYQYAIVHGSAESCNGAIYPSIFIRLDNEETWNWIMQKVFPSQQGDNDYNMGMDTVNHVRFLYICRALGHIS